MILVTEGWDAPTQEGAREKELLHKLYPRRIPTPTPVFPELLHWPE